MSQTCRWKLLVSFIINLIIIGSINYHFSLFQWWIWAVRVVVFRSRRTRLAQWHWQVLPTNERSVMADIGAEPNDKYIEGKSDSLWVIPVWVWLRTSLLVLHQHGTLQWVSDNIVKATVLVGGVFGLVNANVLKTKQYTAVLTIR